MNGVSTTSCTWQKHMRKHDKTNKDKVIWSGINLQKLDSELLHSGAPLEVYICIPAIHKRILLHPTSNYFAELLWSSLRFCVLRFKKKLKLIQTGYIINSRNISWMHYRYIMVYIPIAYPFKSPGVSMIRSQQAQCSPVPPCSAPPWRDENWG